METESIISMKKNLANFLISIKIEKYSFKRFYYIVEYNKMERWINKFKPENIKSILGNEEAIDDLKHWLKNLEINKKKFLKEKEEKEMKKSNKGKKPRKIKKKKEEIESETENVEENEDENYEDIYVNEDAKKSSEKKSNVLIIGNHGCGKTSFVNTIVKELGYEITNVNICDISSKKNISENVEKLMNGIDIWDGINNEDNRYKKIIVIDEIELITTQNEKKFVEHLLKENDNNWYCPVVLISSLKHSKTINLFKKMTCNIKLEIPTNVQMQILMFKILTKENLGIKVCEKTKVEDVVKIIIDHSQNDYRRLINLLQDLYKTFDKSVLTKNNIEEYFEMSKKKDTDIEIYSMTSDLMFNYKNMNECMKAYNGEKVIIPLMIEQNYLKTLFGSYKNVIDLGLEISESFSIGDIIENYIYSEQNWDMQDVHSFYTCILPSYKISSQTNKTNINQIRLEFPKDFNRTSIKFINKKNMLKANSYFPYMDINDFMYLSTLTKKLYENNKYKTFYNMYNEYGANMDIVSSIMKIDKIDMDKEKTQTQTNIKKIFEKYKKNETE